MHVRRSSQTSSHGCRSYVNKPLERFSLECRKVIGFASATLHGLKNSRQFFIQSEVKPIVTHSHAFSRSLYQLNVILIGSMYCVCSLWLARVITLVLVWRHSTENHSISIFACKKNFTKEQPLCRCYVNKLLTLLSWSWSLSLLVFWELKQTWL